MPDSRSRQGHQRVHEQWAHLRFAVVGWLLAAPPEKGELRAAITDLAQRTWQHPTTGEKMTFIAPVPGDVKGLLEAAGLAV